MAQEKLKKRVKKKWVEALRSGRYEQGKSALAHMSRYCCLGVLCEVALENGVDVQKERDGDFALYDNNYTFLPDSVKLWATRKAGRRDDNGNFVVEDQTLSFLNDSGKPFTEIADLIEEYL